MTMTNDEILEAYRLGREQFWRGTPRDRNPFKLGRAKPDLDAADVFDCGWLSAEREAEAVDKALERMEAEG